MRNWSQRDEFKYRVSIKYFFSSNFEIYIWLFWSRQRVYLCSLSLVVSVKKIYNLKKKTLCLMNTLYTKCLIITGCSNSFAKFCLKYEQLFSRIIFHFFFSIWNFQSKMAQRKLDTLHLCGKTAMQINNLTFVSLNNTQSINHTEVLCLQLKLMILIVAIPHIV